MVGLPARGKTYISKKLSRYLNWIGINTRGMYIHIRNKVCRSINVLSAVKFSITFINIICFFSF